jgi:hypothetical protein
MLYEHPFIEKKNDICIQMVQIRKFSYFCLKIGIQITFYFYK